MTKSSIAIVLLRLGLGIIALAPAASAQTEQEDNTLLLTLPDGSKARLAPGTVIRIRRALANETKGGARTRIDWLQMMLVREEAEDVATRVGKSVEALAKLRMPEGSTLWFNANAAQGPMPMTPSEMQPGIRSSMILDNRIQYLANTPEEVRAELEAKGGRLLPVPLVAGRSRPRTQGQALAQAQRPRDAVPKASAKVAQAEVPEATTQQGPAPRVIQEAPQVVQQAPRVAQEAPRPVQQTLPPVPVAPSPFQQAPVQQAPIQQAPAPVLPLPAPQVAVMEQEPPAPRAPQILPPIEPQAPQAMQSPREMQSPGAAQAPQPAPSRVSRAPEPSRDTSLDEIWSTRNEPGDGVGQTGATPERIEPAPQPSRRTRERVETAQELAQPPRRAADRAEPKRQQQAQAPRSQEWTLPMPGDAPRGQEPASSSQPPRQPAGDDIGIAMDDGRAVTAQTRPLEIWDPEIIARLKDINKAIAK